MKHLSMWEKRRVGLARRDFQWLEHLIADAGVGIGMERGIRKSGPLISRQ